MMAAALALLFAGALAQKRQVMLDKVVAVVGGSSILYSEVDDYARQLTEQRRQEGYTSDRDPMNEALEALMTQKLLYNQAQIDSVKVNDADIMARVEEQVQQMVEAEGSIPQLEAKHHMPIFNIREIMRQRYEEQAYANSMQTEVVDKVSVIPGEVERFYKSISKDSLPLVADQYVYAQITKFPKSMTAAKQRTRERLIDMRERVITGKAKFENLARRWTPRRSNSSTPHSARRWRRCAPARFPRWSSRSSASTSSSFWTSAAGSIISATSCCVRSTRPRSWAVRSIRSTVW